MRKFVLATNLDAARKITRCDASCGGSRFCQRKQDRARNGVGKGTQEQDGCNANPPGGGDGLAGSAIEGKVGTFSYAKRLEVFYGKDQKNDAELTKSIIGTIGDLDAYLLPDAKGWTSMSRVLLGYTEIRRQEFRDEVLNTKLQDFKAFGEVLGKLAASQKDSQTRIVVLGSSDAIEQANKTRPGLLQVIKVL